MAEFLLATASAFWLGMLTSISPCPLATNIAAVSFVGRRVGSPFKVLLAGLLYTCGRAATYAGLGMVLVSGFLAPPVLSHVLQKYVNRLLGPILILVGMVLLELIQFKLSGPGVGERTRKRAERLGTWGALLLGVVFALSFCPFSAVLFFGSLLPIALRCESAVVIPLTYGLGTGLPVLAFAVLIALGAGSLGRAYDRLAHFERWARRVTGVIFIGAGVYYCLAHIFGAF